MLNLLRAKKETAATRLAAENTRYLRYEIERSKCAIDTAQNHFEQVVDPTLIDYELNAAQLRYQFLLRKFKSQEI